MDKKEARKRMLKKMKKEASDDIYSPMKENMSKVTITSDSKEGLEKGLSKAQEILKKREEMMEDGDDYECGGKKDKYMDGGIKEQGEMKKKDQAYYRGDKDPYYSDLDKMNDEEYKKKKKR